ncbi:prephenate dehydrogenase [Anaerosacchariphilus polymeriproducens]|uniref:Prephenate dehydrogenase n=1 Tax=Anaerosacchariphilus polymeriproducens TaxID=1812858 RepID=A0A371AUB8_9FIRM|nr:prephenate dehydrogenase [Anaerosacchariphilus polymeriproducens]RDU23163.1 prephenate dehydrogenase [Anaerosacchariphilus polymeriproducens]
MNEITIGFIGLGLIGGSIAKTIRRIIPEYRLLAYDIDTANLKLAQTEGVIDEIYCEINHEFSRCDFIFLCAPVSDNCENLLLLKPYLKPSCILTDVGSVKSDIHKKIMKTGQEKMFIGGHPMAGSEKIGYQNASAYLIENVYYLLTPSDSVSETKISVMIKLIASLGAIPLILSFSEHDKVTANISHLPHILASSLVNYIKESDNNLGIMKTVAAGGFKDITRIASSSPYMWQQICLSNKAPILTALKGYIKYLTQIKKELEQSSKDNLYDFFNSAREYRNSFSSASTGPIKKSYEVYCDIVDETGQIASLAGILAKNNISIKNIGIIHNREFEEGVLRIEFYNENATSRAIELLRKYHYTVYERS